MKDEQKSRLTVLAIEIFGESALNHDVLSTREEVIRFKSYLEETTEGKLRENALNRMRSYAAAENRWVI